jgi:imidazolonepropionase-like amidohydrolase
MTLNLNCHGRVTDLSVTSTTGLSSTPIVIDNANIITLNSKNDVIANGRIVIENGVITALGPRQQVSIPPNAKILDVAGGSVSPGYIDTHAHWSGTSR